MSDHIRKVQSERKWEQLSANSMVKGLHNVFRSFVNELNNSLPTLVESGS